MKRLATLVLLVFSLYGCQRSAPAPKEAAQTAGKVQIGVMTIQTGPAADYGTYTTNGLNLALKELPNPSVTLIYKDTKADPQEAMRVFKELAAASVPLVIGPFTSSESRQVGPEAQRAGVVMITPSATADELSNIGDHMFMMLPPNRNQGRDQARYAADKLGAKRAAILYALIPYGQTMRESFSAAFQAAGGEIVADEGYPEGTEDFRDLLRKIAPTKPDVVFIPVQDSQGGRIVRQAREINFPKAHFLGGDGAMSDTMISLGGEAAEGFVVSNIASADPAFDKLYRDTYGSDPSPYAASAYDTLKLVNQLAAAGARSAADFQAGLVALKGYQGASGLTKFTKVDKSYWCLDKEYSQFVVRGGQFVLVK